MNSTANLTKVRHVSVSKIHGLSAFCLKPLSTAMMMWLSSQGIAQASSTITAIDGTKNAIRSLGTEVKSTVTNGSTTTYDITNKNIHGKVVFNSFAEFNLNKGDIANLKPGSADQVSTYVNLVDNASPMKKTEINGILNSFIGQDKEQHIGGNVIFADPNGIVVGASGVVNVGSLTMTTPSHSELKKLFDLLNKDTVSATGAHEKTDQLVTDLMQGKYASARSTITVTGEINASHSINIFSAKDVIIGEHTEESQQDKAAASLIAGKIFENTVNINFADLPGDPNTILVKAGTTISVTDNSKLIARADTSVKVQNGTIKLIASNTRTVDDYTSLNGSELVAALEEQGGKNSKAYKPETSITIDKNTTLLAQGNSSKINLTAISHAQQVAGIVKTASTIDIKGALTANDINVQAISKSEVNISMIDKLASSKDKLADMAANLKDKFPTEKEITDADVIGYLQDKFSDLGGSFDDHGHVHMDIDGTVFSGLIGFLPLGTGARVDSSPVITVYDGANINASNTLSLKAEARRTIDKNAADKSASLLDGKGIPIPVVGYAELTGEGKVTVNSGATLHSGGDMTIQSFSNNVAKLTASASNSSDGDGSQLKTTGLAFSMINTHFATVVQLDHGAKISTDSNLILNSYSEQQINNHASFSATGQGALGGPAVALSLLRSTTNTILNADVSKANNLNAEALNIVSEQRNEADVKAGATAEDNKKAQEQKPSALDPLKSYLGDFVKTKLGIDATHKDTLLTNVKIRIGSATAISVTHNNVAAIIGSQPETKPQITVSGDVVLLAQQHQNSYHNSAISSVNADAKNNDGTKTGLSAAVTYAELDQHTNAVIGDAVNLTASRLGGGAYNNNQTLDFSSLVPSSLTDIADVISKLKDLKNEPDQFIKKYATNFANSTISTANKNSVGIAGNVVVTNNDIKSHMWIGDSTTISLNKTNGKDDWLATLLSGKQLTFNGALDLKANNDIDQLNIAGDILAQLKSKKDKDTETSSVGGNVNVLIDESKALAGMGAATINNIKDMHYQALETEKLINLASAGGAADTFTGAGALVVNVISSGAVAFMDNRAQVHVDTLDLTAKQDMGLWSAAGAISLGSENSAGISAVVNVLDTDVRAFIGQLDREKNDTDKTVRPDDLLIGKRGDITQQADWHVTNLNVMAHISGQSGAFSVAAAKSSTKQEDENPTADKDSPLSGNPLTQHTTDQEDKSSGDKPNENKENSNNTSPDHPTTSNTDHEESDNKSDNQQQSPQDKLENKAPVYKDKLPQLSSLQDAIDKGIANLKAYSETWDALSDQVAGVQDKISSGLANKVKPGDSELTNKIKDNKVFSAEKVSKMKKALSGAGSVSINYARQITKASIDGITLSDNSEPSQTPAATVTNILALNNTHQYSASGGGALTLINGSGGEKATGLAGAGTLNLLDNTTEALLKDTIINKAHNVNVQSATSGDQLSIALGLAAAKGAEKNTAVAMAPSVAIVTNRTTAQVEGSTIHMQPAADKKPRDINVIGYDRSRQQIGGGNLAFTFGNSGTSVGGALALGVELGQLNANWLGSTADNFDHLAVNANSASKIQAGAMGVALALGKKGSASNAGQGSMSIVVMDNTIAAKVDKLRNVDSSLTGNDVQVRAASVKSNEPANSNQAETSQDMPSDPLDLDAIINSNQIQSGSINFDPSAANNATKSINQSFTDDVDVQGLLNGSDDEKKSTSLSNMDLSGEYVLALAGAVSGSTNNAFGAGLNVIYVASNYNSSLLNTTVNLTDSLSAGKTVPKAVPNLRVTAEDSTEVVSAAANASGSAKTTGTITGSVVIGRGQVNAHIQVKNSNDITHLPAIMADGIEVSALRSGQTFSLAGGISGSGKTAAGAAFSAIDSAHSTSATLDGQDSELAFIKTSNNTLVRAGQSEREIGVGFSVAGSGSTAIGGALNVNLISDTTNATVNHVYLDSGTITIDVGLPDNQQEKQADIKSVAAVIAGSGGTAGGLSLGVNIIKAQHNATLKNAIVTSRGDISMKSGFDGDIWGLSTSLAGSAKKAASGSIIYNEIAGQDDIDDNSHKKTNDNVQSHISISNSHLTAETNSKKAPSLKLDASAGKLFIASLSGSISGSGGSALGAAISDNVISAKRLVDVDNGSVIKGFGDMSLKAAQQQTNYAISIGGSGAGSNAIAGSFTINTLSGTEQARINNATVEVGSLTLDASGGERYSWSLGGAFAGAGKTAVGVANTDNWITASRNAIIKESDITTTGLITLLSGGKSDIRSLAVGASGAGSTAAGASVAYNSINGNEEASLDQVIVRSASAVKLDVQQGDATIKTLAGNAAGSGNAAGAGAVAISDIGQTRNAYIKNSSVNSKGDIDVLAHTGGIIDTLSASGAAATGTAAIAASNSTNTITSKTKAKIANSSGFGKDVTVQTTDSSIINALSGAAAVAGGGAAGIGTAINHIKSDISASVSGLVKDDVKDKDNTFLQELNRLTQNHRWQLNNLIVDAGTSSTIDTIAISAGGGGTAAIAETLSLNNIKSTIKAAIDNGVSILARHNVGVSAHNEDRIIGKSGALAGSGTAAIGALQSLNKLNSTTSATINGNDLQKTQVTALNLGNDQPRPLITSGELLDSEGKPNDVIINKPKTPTEKDQVNNQLVTEKFNPFTKWHLGKQAVNGIVVQASTVQQLGQAAATAAASGAGAVAGLVSVGSLAGSTEASVIGATLNAEIPDNTVASKQDISVNASTHLISSGYLVSAALSGGLSIGGVVDSSNVSHITNAQISNSSIVQANTTNVHANSTQQVMSTLAGLAAGGLAGGAVNVSALNMGAVTTAQILNPLRLITNNLSVSAIGLQSITPIDATVAAGGGAVGGNFVSLTNNTHTYAIVSQDNQQQGHEIQVKTDNASISADNNSQINDATVAGISAGGVALAGSALIIRQNTDTQATLKNAVLHLDQGSLSVTAHDNVHMDTFVGAGSIGGIAGGASVNVIVANSKANAQISNSNVLLKATDGKQNVNVNALRDGNIDMQSTVLSAGLGSIGGTVAVLELGDGALDISADKQQVNASKDENLTKNTEQADKISRSSKIAAAPNKDGSQAKPQQHKTWNAKDNQWQDDSDTTRVMSEIDSDSMHEVTTLVANPDNYSSHQTVAEINGGNIEAGNNTINVISRDEMISSNKAGVENAGAVAVGGSVALTYSNARVTAQATPAKLTAGSLNVNAQAKPASNQANDFAVQVGSTAGTTGFVGIGAAVSSATMNNQVKAAIGGELNVTSDIEVNASDTQKLNVNATGNAYGAAAAGIVIGLADHSSQSNVEVQQNANIQAKNISMKSLSAGPASISGSGSTGGVGLALSAAVQVAKDNSQASLDVGNGAKLYSDQLTLKSVVSPRLFADNLATTISGLVSVGGVVVVGNLTATSQLKLGDNVYLQARNATICSDVSRPVDSNKKPIDTIHVHGFSVAGSGLAAINAVQLYATSGATSQLLTGENDTFAAADSHQQNYSEQYQQDPGWHFYSNNSTSQNIFTDAHSIGGVLAAGAYSSDMHSRSITQTDVNGRFLNHFSSLKVEAISDTNSSASVTAGSGGIISGSAAKASTSDHSTTSASLFISGQETSQNQSDERANVDQFTLKADHTVGLSSSADSSSASLAGASGAYATNTYNATTLAKLKDNSRLLTLAYLQQAKTHLTGGANINSGSGGVLDHAAGKSTTYINQLITDSDIGNNVDLRVGDDWRKGQTQKLVVEALNKTNITNYAKLKTGGAIALARVHSNINAHNVNAGVKVGDNSNLYTTGMLTLAASGNLNNSATAQSSTYGLASAAAGSSSSEVYANYNIHIGTGANLFSYSSINLNAGADQDNAPTSGTIAAITDLYNKTAIPISDQPKADVLYNHHSNVTVDKGAVLSSVADININANNGLVYLDSNGNSTDLYKQFIETLVGTSLATHYSNAKNDANSSAVLNGKLNSGAYHHRALVIDDLAYFDANDNPISTHDVISIINSTQHELDDALQQTRVTLTKTDANSISVLINTIELGRQPSDSKIIQGINDKQQETVSYNLPDIASMMSSIASSGSGSYTRQPLDNTLTWQWSDGTQLTSAQMATLNGIVNPGIQSETDEQNKAIATITRETSGGIKLGIAVNNSQTTPDMTFTTTTTTYGNELNKRINQLNKSIHDYYSSPDTVSAFQAELNSLERTKSSITDQLNGVSPEGINQVYVYIDPIIASSGNIKITADQVSGAGELHAPGDVSVDIINNSAAVLNFGKPKSKPGKDSQPDQILPSDQLSSDIPSDQILPSDQLSNELPSGQLSNDRGIYIPEHQGGLITLNGDVVNIDELDEKGQNKFKGFTQFVFEAKNHPLSTFGSTSKASDVPEITITSSFSPPVDNPLHQIAPDIFVNNTLKNNAGNITIKDARGSIYVEGNIYALKLDIGTGKNFVLDSSGFANLSKPNMTGLIANFDDDNQGSVTTSALTTNIPEKVQNELLHQGIVTNYRYSPGASIVAGADVIVHAEFLNINGLIQSGVANWNAAMDNQTAQAIQNIDGIMDGSKLPARLKEMTSTVYGVSKTHQEAVPGSKDEAISAITYNQHHLSLQAGSNLVRLQSDDVASGSIGYSYDYVNHKMVLDPVESGGGYIELTGKVLSTGGGNIKAFNGYAHINVDNQTDTPLDLQSISLGKAVEGHVRINDVERVKQNNIYADDASSPAVYTTEYKMNGQTKTIESKEMLFTGKPDDEKTFNSLVYTPLNIRYNEENNGTPYSASVDYQTTDGRTYVWLRGTDFSTRRTEQLDFNTFLGASYNREHATVITKDEPVASKDIDNTYYLGTTNNSKVKDLQQGQVLITMERKQTKKGVWEPTTISSWCDKQFIICLKPHTRIKNVLTTGNQDIVRYQIKGDFPVPVSFLGYQAPEINITSGSQLRLTDSIYNEGGDVRLTMSKPYNSITQTDSTIAISSKNLSLNSAGDIGSSGQAVRVNVTDNLSAISSLQGDINLSSLNAGDHSHINLQALSASNGDIQFSARNNVTADANVVIKGDSITLTTTGTLGTSDTPLLIQTRTLAKHPSNYVLTANGDNGVFVQQQSGNLWVKAVHSNGDVAIKVADGDLLDGDNTRSYDKRALDKLWSDLGLLKSEQSDKDLEKQRTALVNAGNTKYQRYWQLRRNPNYNPDSPEIADHEEFVNFDAINIVVSGEEQQQIIAQLTQSDQGVDGKQIHEAIQKRYQEKVLEAADLNKEFGELSYDQNYNYKIKDSDLLQIQNTATWTEDELKNTISLDLQSRGGKSSTVIESMNLTGKNIILTAKNIGRNLGDTITVDLSANNKTPLTDEQKSALLMAQPADISFPFADKPLTAQVKQRDDFNVGQHDGGSLTASAKGQYGNNDGLLFIGTDNRAPNDNEQWLKDYKGININQLMAGEITFTTGNGAITAVQKNNGQQHIIGNSLYLVAFENGDIGHADSVLHTKINGLTHIDGGDVYVHQSGDLLIDRLTGSKALHLTVDGSLTSNVINQAENLLGGDIDAIIHGHMGDKLKPIQLGTDGVLNQQDSSKYVTLQVDDYAVIGGIQGNSIAPGTLHLGNLTIGGGLTIGQFASLLQTGDWDIGTGDQHHQDNGDTPIASGLEINGGDTWQMSKDSHVTAHQGDIHAILQSAANLASLNAAHDMVITASQLSAPTDNRLWQAGNAITLTSTVGDTGTQPYTPLVQGTVATLNSKGNIFASLQAGFTSGSVQAAQNIALYSLGDNTLTRISSNHGTIDLQATGTFNVADINTPAMITLSGDNLTVSHLVQTSAAVISKPFSGQLKLADVQATRLDGQASTLILTRATLTDALSLRSSHSMTVGTATADSIDLQQTSPQTELDERQPDAFIHYSNLKAAQQLTITADSDVTGNSATSNNDAVTVKGQNVQLTAISATKDVQLTASGNMDVTDSTSSNGSQIWQAGGAITSLQHIHADQNVTLEAANDIQLAQADSNQAMSLHSANGEVRFGIKASPDSSAEALAVNALSAASLTITADAGDIVGGNAITTAQNMVLHGNNLHFGKLQSHYDMTLKSSGDGDQGQGNIYGLSAISINNLSMEANGTIQIDGVKHGGIYSLKSGKDLTLIGNKTLMVSGDVKAERDMKLVSTDELKLDAVSSGRDMRLVSDKKLEIGAINAGGIIELNAHNGDILLRQDAVSTARAGMGDVTLQGNHVDVQNISTQGGNILATVNNWHGKDLYASAGIKLQAQNAITLLNSVSGGDTVLTSGADINAQNSHSDGSSNWQSNARIIFALMNAKDAIMLNSQGKTEGKQATSGATLEIRSTNDGIQIAEVSAGQHATLNAAKSIVLTNLDSGGNVNLNALNDIQAVSSHSNGDQHWRAGGNIDADDLQAQGQALLDSLMNMRVKSLHSNGPATLNAGWRDQQADDGSIDVADLQATDVSLIAGRNINAGNGQIGGNLHMQGQHMRFLGHYVGTDAMHIWASGSGEPLARKLDVSLQAQQILFERLDVADNQIHTSADNVEIKYASGVDLLDMQTAQSHVLMDNVSAQYRPGGDVQFYQLNKTFTLKQDGKLTTTDGVVIHRHPYAQLLFSENMAKQLGNIVYEENNSTAHYASQLLSSAFFDLNNTPQVVEKMPIFQWQPQATNVTMNVNLNMEMITAAGLLSAPITPKPTENSHSNAVNNINSTRSDNVHDINNNIRSHHQNNSQDDKNNGNNTDNGADNDANYNNIIKQDGWIL